MPCSTTSGNQITSDTDTVPEVIVVPRCCCCNSYTTKNVSSCSSNLDLMVSQHPKLKSGRFVKDVLAKVGQIMKEVAQRCWACWGAQRASKRPKKLKGGILDSSMVCSLIPDLWGDGAKRREKKKKIMLQVGGSHKSVTERTPKKPKGY